MLVGILVLLALTVAFVPSVFLRPLRRAGALPREPRFSAIFLSRLAESRAVQPNETRLEIQIGIQNHEGRAVTYDCVATARAQGAVVAEASEPIRVNGAETAGARLALAVPDRGRQEIEVSLGSRLPSLSLWITAETRGRSAAKRARPRSRNR
ncbi:MAG: hypothetical protein ACLP8S_19635 [Solirubrobacteraceae bacterium]